jgi:hypothetical protein
MADAIAVGVVVIRLVAARTGIADEPPHCIVGIPFAIATADDLPGEVAGVGDRPGGVGDTHDFAVEVEGTRIGLAARCPLLDRAEGGELEVGYCRRAGDIHGFCRLDEAGSETGSARCPETRAPPCSRGMSPSCLRRSDSVH